MTPAGSGRTKPKSAETFPRLTLAVYFAYRPMSSVLQPPEILTFFANTCPEH